MIVARYFFAPQAAESALLRTAATGVPHHTAYDRATDTYVVTQETR